MTAYFERSKMTKKALRKYGTFLISVSYFFLNLIGSFFVEKESNDTHNGHLFVRTCTESKAEDLG